jgi:hypothetical protein
MIAKSTKTYTFLCDKFKLDDVERDSPTLLDALAYTTKSNQRVSEGTCCKATQHHTSVLTGRPVKAVDTIYPDMTILCLRQGARKGSPGICGITIEGEHDVPIDDLCWKSGPCKGICAWKKCFGNWTGSLRRPPIASPYEPSSPMSAKDTATATKIAGKVEKCNGKQTKKVGDCEKARIGMKRKKSQGGRSKAKVYYDGSDEDDDDDNDEDEEDEPGSEDEEASAAPRWVAFNHPSQADVLISSLTCRYPVNQCALLGRVLGKPPGVSAVKKKDVQLRLVNGVVQMWVPSIKLGDGSHYYPPMPTGSWGVADHMDMGDGRVGFRTKDIGRRYALIRLLMDRFDNGLRPFLIRLLEMPGMEFQPQRLHVSTRLRDPTKMIVLYDNDKRQIEPMALCLELKQQQGLFALLDGFGRILRDTCIRFFLHE